MVSRDLDGAKKLLETFPKVSNRSIPTQLQISLANVCLMLARFELAEKWLVSAYRQGAKDLDTYINLSGLLLASRKLDDLKPILEEGISIYPENATLLLNKATCVNLAGDTKAAIEAANAARAIEPTNPHIYYNLGKFFYDDKKFTVALRHYERAVRLKFDYSQAWINLGNCWRELNDPIKALVAYKFALKFRPNYVPAIVNIGNSYLSLGKSLVAVFWLKSALALDTKSPHIWFNLGNAYYEALDLEKAGDCYTKAININPNYSEAYVNRALIDLTRKNYERGWKDYEWRHKNSETQIFFEIHSLIVNKKAEDEITIVLSELGYGDTIQFARYVLRLADGSKDGIIFCVEPALYELFRTQNWGKVTIVSKASPIVSAGHAVTALSLPYLLNLTQPFKLSKYIKAPTDRVKIWRQFLGDKTKPRIGIAWQGNSLHKNDFRRSISLAEFLKIFTKNFELIVLQKLISQKDQELIGKLDLDIVRPRISDFADTAALCELVDVVLSVDTSIAHVAGAVGKPHIILVPEIPDFRWGLWDQESVWYEQSYLVRQTSPRWDEAVKIAQSKLFDLLR